MGIGPNGPYFGRRIVEITKQLVGRFGSGRAEVEKPMAGHGTIVGMLLLWFWVDGRWL